jgi:hypothetical protein
VLYLHRGLFVFRSACAPVFVFSCFLVLVFIAAFSSRRRPFLLRAVLHRGVSMSASSIVSFRVCMLLLLFHSAREHVFHRRRRERKWVQLLLQLAEAGELEVLDDRRSLQIGV